MKWPRRILNQLIFFRECVPTIPFKTIQHTLHQNGTMLKNSNVKVLMREKKTEEKAEINLISRYCINNDAWICF